MIAQLLPLLGGLLDKVIPDPAAATDAKIRMLELAQRGELAQLDAEKAVTLAQIDVNKADAQSQDQFQRRWRPAAGWVCVLGLGYNFLLQPLLSWLSTLKGWPVPPILDVEQLLVLLSGLLGLGGFRTVERVRGFQPTRPQGARPHSYNWLFD